MGAPPELVVAPSATQLADDVAARLVATLVSVQGMRPLAHLVVTAGGILERVIGALGESPARDSIDWSRVAVWWGDERYVPSDSADRNDTALMRADLEALPLDPRNVHRMPASGGAYGEDADAAARAYASELAAAVPAGQGEDDVPHFDVILLGVGPDGHCASLFPEHPGVYELDASVIAVHNSPKPPPTRLSLTFRSLDAATEPAGYRYQRPVRAVDTGRCGLSTATPPHTCLRVAIDRRLRACAMRICSSVGAGWMTGPPALERQCGGGLVPR